MRKALALAMLLGPAALAQAATIIYTDESAFLAQVAAPYYLEDFTGIANPVGSSKAYGPVNSYAFTASADNGLYANVNALTTYSPQDELLFTFTGSAVHAVGAIFTTTDTGGNPVEQTLTVQTSGGGWQTVTTSGFVGFVSDTDISWLAVTSDGFLPSHFPQVDHLYVGTNVPEPALLAGAGLLCLGLLRRR